MNNLKNKTLHAAVLAGLAAVCAAGPANAVHINPNGLGQVLIFPYYTARAGQFTAVLIANTQNNTKAVKVRFLEGKNGREVLDFNLFLSPNDIWTGAVVATAGGARIISNDNSCVTPSDLFAETRTDGLGLAMNAFKNYAYTGAAADNPALSSMDRTREGFFEVIEMGVIDDDLITGNTMTAGNTAPIVTGYIKHDAAGVPANCGALDAFDASSGRLSLQFPNTGATGPLMQPPRGGLAGRASIINSATGANYTFSPTALDAWSATVKYSGVGSAAPLLTAVNPLVSNILTSEGVVTATWATGREAISAALMRDSVQNEFILDTGTQSQTDWIVTFPTKHYLVGIGPGVAATTAAPFANNFHNTTNDGSCDFYDTAVFSREEKIPSTNNNTFVSGGPVITPLLSQMCMQANVIPFGTSSMLASTNAQPLTPLLDAFVSNAISFAVAPATPAIGGLQGPNGRFVMKFNAAWQHLTPLSATKLAMGNLAPVAFNFGTHNGMPVIGAMVHNYLNTGVASRYGGVIDHKFTRSVNP